jgi:hypothetical protein
VAIRVRKSATSHQAGERPNPSEERAVLAGVSATAAVAGQTHIHSGTVSLAASRGRPLRLPQFGFERQGSREPLGLFLLNGCQVGNRNSTVQKHRPGPVNKLPGRGD